MLEGHDPAVDEAGDDVLGPDLARDALDAPALPRHEGYADGAGADGALLGLEEKLAADGPLLCRLLGASLCPLQGNNAGAGDLGDAVPVVGVAEAEGDAGGAQGGEGAADLPALVPLDRKPLRRVHLRVLEDDVEEEVDAGGALRPVRQPRLEGVPVEHLEGLEHPGGGHVEDGLELEVGVDKVPLPQQGDVGHELADGDEVDVDVLELLLGLLPAHLLAHPLDVGGNGLAAGGGEAFRAQGDAVPAPAHGAAHAVEHEVDGEGDGLERLAAAGELRHAALPPVDLQGT